VKITLCPVNVAAAEKLPPHTDDRSGAGVLYVDAYIAPMNAQLEDGTAVRCKRRGLKIVLSVGDRTGEGLLRRLEAGPDPVAMLNAALQEAAGAAGIGLSVENGAMVLTLNHVDRQPPSQEP
jgi:hypothetical protein